MTSSSNEFITTAELRQLSTVLLDHLNASGYSTIEIDIDYYWTISQDERYDPYKQPTNLSLGQVSDDLAELRKIQNGEMPPVGAALGWLSAVLSAISAKVVC